MALADVTDDALPAGLVSATGPDTLDPAKNPINGRRGGAHPIAGAPWCTADPADPRECLVATLDTLGFDVTGGTTDDQARHLAQAIAAVRRDAGLAKGGGADEALLRYLGTWPGTAGGRADEVRTLGRSAEGRAITAYRYGHGARVVLVVAQTHGDEEAGLRVWLRSRSLPVPAGVTMWIVPTINPDGLVHDTRFLAGGADPNRKSPTQPEQQLLDDFARSVRPVLGVWYHQNYGWIGGSGASMEPARAYHQRVQLGALYRSGDCALGFTWCSIDDAVGSSSILVELPDIVTPADVRRHADALLASASSAP